MVTTPLQGSTSVHKKPGNLATCIQKHPSDLGTHSMRRSGASFLSCIGVPLHEIKSVGDLKSLAVLAYLVTPLERKEQIDSYAATVLNGLG